MNHLYRVIWNNSLNCWQAVVETAKGKTKSSKNTQRSRIKSHRSATLSLTLLSSLCAMNAMALPIGGSVVAGSGTATISTSGTTMTVNQTTPKAAINWNSFSLGATDIVNFTQPSATAITLNRVTGTAASTISGKINANGQVFILNPNGILTNNTAQINVGGLVASTLALSDSDFQAGTYRFAGTTNTKTVENKGAITVPTGGTVALIAPTVKHSGTITAPQGNAFLAAAGDVTISMVNGSPITYTINQGKAQALITTGGMISASGGTVILTAQGIDALSSAVVNATGTIEAKTVGTKKGVIQLLSDMDSGTVNVSGTLDASSPTTGTAGGLIKTYGSDVKVASNTIITTKKAGQTTLPATSSYWELKAKNINVEAGSNISGATLGAALQNGNVTLNSVGTALDKGYINVNEDATWSVNTGLNLTAVQDINFNSELKGTANSTKLVMNYGVGHDYNISDNGKITLTGATPILLINGTSYTVVNQLGTEQDGSINTLQGMGNNLSGNYALGSDIDATDTVNWNSGLGFQPIGTVQYDSTGVKSVDTPYTGSFHGLGHTINNLSINYPVNPRSNTSPYFVYQAVGLFGATSNTIRDVGLVGGSISGSFMTGALVGLQLTGSINHSYSSANVSGTVAVGGLVGVSGENNPTNITINFGSINNSYATGQVNGSVGVGGLVGISAGSIRNSYATGDVTMPDSGLGEPPGQIFGGLAGAATGDITDSYATGNVYGNIIEAGGLVGQYNSTQYNSTEYNFTKDTNPTMSGSYATGNVSIIGTTGGLQGSAGGLIGSASDARGGTHTRTVHINNSYATGNVSTPDSIYASTGGLIGYNSTNSTVNNSYATGQVVGSNSNITNSHTGNGGLVGVNKGSINNSYAVGEVSGVETSTGGLVGLNTGTVTNSFWNTETSGQLTSADGLGKTTAEMSQIATFLGWDIADVSDASSTSLWVIDEGNSAPTLR